MNNPPRAFALLLSGVLCTRIFFFFSQGAAWQPPEPAQRGNSVSSLVPARCLLPAAALAGAACPGPPGLLAWARRDGAGLALPRHSWPDSRLSRDSRCPKLIFSCCREAGFWRIAIQSAPEHGFAHQQRAGVAVPAQLMGFVGSAGAFSRCFCARGFITSPAVSHL